MGGISSFLFQLYFKATFQPALSIALLFFHPTYIELFRHLPPPLLTWDSHILLLVPLSLLVPSAFCLPRASFLPRWWGRTTKQKKASLAVSSAHSPLLHNSWFAHFFSQWSAHISVSCEHCSRNVSKCSGYRSTLIQTKHIVQSHIHPNAYSCHCPPKSVASSMISPLS